MEVKLVFIKKDQTTQSFLLPSAVTFIGRRQDCDLCIPLSMVSRRHCEIYNEFGKVMIRNLKSRNGTYVNDESIDETQIKAGDTLRIGPIHFIVQIDGVPPSKDETQEADFDDLIAGSPGANAGQSQTMDLDDVFSNDFLGGDDFDLDSDLP
ncbi:MAG: FHA domain-containing protein [Planctomycetota bacterium]|jgi:pSer/pThr/pTyr-binding forkhead associated (FHA) protein